MIDKVLLLESEKKLLSDAKKLKKSDLCDVFGIVYFFRFIISFTEFIQIGFLSFNSPLLINILHKNINLLVNFLIKL
jgi:hypothetical protein